MSERTVSGRVHWLVALLLLAVSSAAGAQHRAELIELPIHGTLGNLKEFAVVRADPEGRFDPGQLVSSDAGFEPYTPDLEESAPPLWLKLRLAAPADSEGLYVLKVARRFFEDLDVYIAGSDGQLRQFEAAFDEAVTMETAGRQFAAEFSVPPGQARTVLVYVRTVQASLQPLEIWVQDQSGFAQTRADNLLLFGLLFGVLIALIFHNFILYLNLRQRGHLFYVLAVLSLLLLLSIDSGLLQTHLLPASLLDDVTRINVVASAMMMVTISLFFLAFVDPKRKAPGLAKILRVLIALVCAGALLVAFVPSAHFLQVTISLQLAQFVTQFFLLVAALIVGRRGLTEGYIFFAAWALFIASGFSRVLISLDILPRTGPLEYAMYFGAVAETSILALGLTWRVRQLYERHARAIEEQHKAARLANLDPLTDAYNRRFLQTYLDSVMPGPGGDSFDRAVLILDLDKFKETNDQYGHAAGDMVLRELVRRCQGVLRQGDVMCRLGGDEFVIVLSDQSDRTGFEVAQRVIDEVAAKPFLFEGEAMPVTTSVGVVSSISPRCAVSDILRMADQALYQAKQAGRNRAVLFDPDKATPFRRGPSRAPLRHEQS